MKRRDEQQGTVDASLSVEEFRQLRDFINTRSGLFFGDDAQYIVERRVSERLAALGLDSFSPYMRMLRGGVTSDAELAELYELLVTKETYFFREEYQLDAFRKELLPVLARDGKARKQLTILSAGCSTGEEVYSIAMVLLESRQFEGWDVRVNGTDISRRSLAFARRAVYAESAFRAMPPEFRRRYFERQEDGYRVIERVRRMCQFGLMNLLELGGAPRFAALDAIFCKNVLIYFDAKSRRSVIDGLYNRLRAGGYLLLGHSESLIQEPARFEVTRLHQDVVYRKPPSAVSLLPSRRRRT